MPKRNLWNLPRLNSMWEEESYMCVSKTFHIMVSCKSNSTSLQYHKNITLMMPVHCLYCSHFFIFPSHFIFFFFSPDGRTSTKISEIILSVSCFYTPWNPPCNSIELQLIFVEWTNRWIHYFKSQKLGQWPFSSLSYVLDNKSEVPTYCSVNSE